MVLVDELRESPRKAVAQAPRAGDRTLSASGFSLEVVDDLQAIGPLWRGFESKAGTTVYQSHVWASLWHRHIGSHQGVRPLVVLGRTPDGKLDFLLPLGVRRTGTARVLGWLGDQRSGYGMGLFTPQAAAALNAVVFATLWRDILAALPQVDVIALLNMPQAWQGQPNPFRHLGHSRSPNDGYVVHLSDDFETLYAAKRSGRTRRKAFKKDKALLSKGRITFRKARGIDETAALVEILARQKNRQLAEDGVHAVFDARMRAFLMALARAGEDAGSPLAAYALERDGEPVAVTLGAIHKTCFHGISMSMALSPLAVHSPGDYAFRQVIRSCCEAGLSALDLGLGRSRYKEKWADETLIMMDAVVLARPAGIVCWIWLKCHLALKRRIKNSPVLWALYTRARRTVAALRPVRAPGAGGA